MKKVIKKVIERSGYAIQKVSEDSEYDRIYNEFSDFTMIEPKTYAENLRIAQLYGSSVKGDVVECGVWRGGMSAGLARLLGSGRKYYLFDSFEGLPPAKEIDGVEAIKWQEDAGSATYFDNCKAEMEFAQKAMQATGAEFELVKGWFSDTLPGFKPRGEIAVLRFDGDWYESTMDCFQNLYPKLNKGGLILIDDYYTWDGCSKAVHDYLSSIKSSSRICSSAGGVCYIIKND